MPILYRIYQNENAKMPKLYGKYYARATVLGTVGIDQLAAIIQEKCTVHEADVVAVLKALSGAVKTQLQLGYRVELPGIGAFKPTLTSSGVSKLDDFDPTKNIKKLRILYQPEKTKDDHRYVTELLRGAKVRQLASLLPNGVGLDDNTGDSDSGSDGNGGSNPIEDRP